MVLAFWTLQVITNCYYDTEWGIFLIFKKKKTALLRHNSHAMKLTVLKYTFQCFLVVSELCNHFQNLRLFLTTPKHSST